jgi:hypothetical protein
MALELPEQLLLALCSLLQLLTQKLLLGLPKLPQY